MAKTKTNEEIFADIRERGVMTEQEMKLLLRRSNAEGKDLLDYDLVENVGEGYGIPLTEEQGRKALVWLYKELRKRDSAFGYREQEIVENASAKDFRLICFYNNSMWNQRNYYVPTYWIDGMEYRVEGGKCIVVG